MTEEHRPDPEELLRALKKEEIQSKKGKLKIFLGMSAGVGKTYAMLEDAQKAAKEGVDLVVGSVNTHGRKETAILLEGLKSIPEKWIEYKDTVFEELDIDEILKLKPQLVIVDELAHSNVPGSRHPKRWQDVMEILDAGIDVYTTLNVQHIESRKDVVENITGIEIRETVPDIILDRANYFELVDITPTELLQRLKEGKVYLGPQSEIAARNFFQEDRLMALREIALRITAEKVDHDLQDMIAAQEKPFKWRPRERLMVAVSQSPYSQHLIRTTRRLAFTLDAPWIALYVDRDQHLEEEENARLAKNLSLARELGAEVVTTSDQDIVQAIERVARQRGVTQLIIGRSLKSWRDFFKKSSVIDQLTNELSGVDIHVVRQSRLSSLYKQKTKQFRLTEIWSQYFIVFCLVLLLTIINTILVPTISYQVVGFLFLLGILLISLFFKGKVTFFSSIVSAIIWNYLFVTPKGSFSVGDPEDILMLLSFLATGAITGILAHRTGENQKMMLKREETAQAFYDIVREIAGAPSLEQVFKAVKERLGSILNGKCEIIVKKIDDGLVFDPKMKIASNEKEQAVANWVFMNGKEAGWSTSTLSSVNALYIPLKGYSETVGVLTYQPNTNKFLSNEEFNFLYTGAQQLANYLERTFTEERARKSEQLNQIEKVYQTILKLISHEFHPPLVTIQESVSYLKGKSGVRDDQISLTEVGKIENMSGNLINIIENISAMAKLGAGLVPLHKELHDIKEVISNSCEILQPSLKFHQLNVIVPDDLPLVPCDFPLIELLLRNLLVNAIKYSPPYTTIEIEAQLCGNHLVLSVSDQGKGIPEDMADQVFEKFYPVPGTESKGAGLGLAIAKTIARIHQGELKVQNRPEGGAKFSLILPIDSTLSEKPA